MSQVYQNEAAWRYTVKSGREISKTTEQPFLFGKLRTTDDDDAACSSEEVIKNLGTIRVTYCRVENIRDSELGVRAPEETKPIHEKNKKARLSHQAAFGEKRAITAGRRSTFNWIDAEEKPLQIFEFRYRSRQLLQLEGHIPDSPEPTPEPSPEPTPDPVENPEEVQRRAEIALLRERLDALERATQGSSQAGSSGLKRVKTEAGQDRDTKKIKKEQGTSSSGSGAAQGKKKKEVLVLSDSD
ncbi:hypothetical protein JCM16303_000611 [Sporobolomyces ruberrimus]